MEKKKGRKRGTKRKVGYINMSENPRRKQQNVSAANDSGTKGNGERRYES